jgi:hypothetical protein
LGATPLVIELTFPGFQGTNAAINKIKSGQPVSDNDLLKNLVETGKSLPSLIDATR